MYVMITCNELHAMSSKGTTITSLAKSKISQALTKDRTNLLKSIESYISSLSPDDFPSLTKCALSSDISEHALLSLEIRTADNHELRVLLDHIRDLQKEYLTTTGLNRKSDSRLSIMLLKANHGLKEDPTTLTQNNTFNVSPEILAEALELSRSKK